MQPDRATDGRFLAEGVPAVLTLAALLLCAVSAAVADGGSDAGPGEDARGRVFYVRQTVGDDTNDGLSPQTAWGSLSRLGPAVKAGDTAIVGPGLYRERILVQADGRPDARITFIGDSTGEHTGDPPGAVLITGAEPVDEEIFLTGDSPGLYQAPFVEYMVKGVTEMDGAQSRYTKVTETREHAIEKLSEVEVVARLPSSFFYDEEAKVLYIQTSDGAHPSEHEIELVRRNGGVDAPGKSFVSIVGFTFRHAADAGIRFMMGACDLIAAGNISWGNNQGIRVHAAADAVISGNTLFRNANSGVYFAKESGRGMATGNVLYDNDKGLRWASASSDGTASNNLLFDNRVGISLENSVHVRLVGNRMIDNGETQVSATGSSYVSEGSCYELRDSGQLFVTLDSRRSFSSLDALRNATHQDLSSREGDCGPLPAKIDVRKLHEETSSYAERARRILAERKDAAAAGEKIEDQPGRIDP